MIGPFDWTMHSMVQSKRFITISHKPHVPTIKVGTCWMTYIKIRKLFYQMYDRFFAFIIFLRDFILQKKNFIWKTSMLKTRTVKSLKEEEIPSGTIIFILLQVEAVYLAYIILLVHLLYQSKKRCSKISFDRIEPIYHGLPKNVSHVNQPVYQFNPSNIIRIYHLQSVSAIRYRCAAVSWSVRDKWTDFHFVIEFYLL